MARARRKGSLIISVRSQREHALMQFFKKQKPIIWQLSIKKSII